MYFFLLLIYSAPLVDLAHRRAIDRLLIANKFRLNPSCPIGKIVDAVNHHVF